MHPSDLVPSLQDLSFFRIYEHIALHSGRSTFSDRLKKVVKLVSEFEQRLNLHPDQTDQERLEGFVQSVLIQNDTQSTLRKCVTWLLHPVGSHIMEQIMRLNLLNDDIVSALMHQNLFTKPMLYSWLALPSSDMEPLDAAHLPLFHLLKTTWGRTQIKRFTPHQLAITGSPDDRTALLDFEILLRPLMHPKLLNATAQSGIEEGSSLIFYLVLGILTGEIFPFEEEALRPPVSENTDMQQMGEEPMGPPPLEFEEGAFRLALGRLCYNYFIRFSELLKDTQHNQTEAAQDWLTHITPKSLFAFSPSGLHRHESLFSLLMGHASGRSQNCVPSELMLFNRWVTDSPHVHAHIYGSTPSPLDIINFFPKSLRKNRVLHDFYAVQFSAQDYHLLSQVDSDCLGQHLAFFMAHPTLFTLNAYQLLRLIPESLIPALLAVYVYSLRPQENYWRTEEVDWIPKALWQLDSSVLRWNLEYILKLDSNYLLHRISEKTEKLSNFWSFVCMKCSHPDCFKALNHMIKLDPRLMISLDCYVKSKVAEREPFIAWRLVDSTPTEVPILQPAPELKILVEIFLAPFAPSLPLGEEPGRNDGMYTLFYWLPEIQNIDDQSREQFFSYLPYLCAHMYQEDNVGYTMSDNQLASLAIRLIAHPQLRCALEYHDYQILREITTASWHRILINSGLRGDVFLELFSLDDCHVLKVLHPETVASLFLYLTHRPELEQVFFFDNAYLLRAHTQRIADALSKSWMYQAEYFTQTAHQWLSACDASLLKCMNDDVLFCPPLLAVVINSWELCSSSAQKMILDRLDMLDESRFAEFICRSNGPKLTRLLSLKEGRIYALLDSPVLNSEPMFCAFIQSGVYRKFILQSPTLSARIDLRSFMQQRIWDCRYAGRLMEDIADIVRHAPSALLDLSSTEQQDFYACCTYDAQSASILEHLWSADHYALLHQFQLSWLSFWQLHWIPEACWKFDDGYLWRQCSPEQLGELLLISSLNQHVDDRLRQYDAQTVISKAQLQAALRERGAECIPMLLRTPVLLDYIDDACILLLRSQDSKALTLTTQNWCDLLSCSEHRLLHRISQETLFRICFSLKDHPLSLLEMDGGYLLGQLNSAHLEAWFKHTRDEFERKMYHEYEFEQVMCPEVYPELFDSPKIYDALTEELVNQYFLHMSLATLEKNDYQLMRLLRADSIQHALNSILETLQDFFSISVKDAKKIKKLIQVMSHKYCPLLTRMEEASESPLASSVLKNEIRSCLNVIFEYLYPEGGWVSGSSRNRFQVFLDELDMLIPLDPEFWTTHIPGWASLERVSFSFSETCDARAFCLRGFAAADGLLARQASLQLNNFSTLVDILKGCREFDADLRKVLNYLLTAGACRLLQKSDGAGQWFEFIDELLRNQHLVEVHIIEEILSLNDHRLLKKIPYDPVMLHRILCHPGCERFLQLDGGWLKAAMLEQDVYSFCSARLPKGLSLFGSQDHKEDQELADTLNQSCLNSI